MAWTNTPPAPNVKGQTSDIHILSPDILIPWWRLIIYAEIRRVCCRTSESWNDRCGSLRQRLKTRQFDFRSVYAFRAIPCSSITIKSWLLPVADIKLLSNLYSSIPSDFRSFPSCEWKWKYRKALLRHGYSCKPLSQFSLYPCHQILNRPLPTSFSSRDKSGYRAATTVNKLYCELRLALCPSH